MVFGMVHVHDVICDHVLLFVKVCMANGYLVFITINYHLATESEYLMNCEGIHNRHESPGII